MLLATPAPLNVTGVPRLVRSAWHRAAGAKQRLALHMVYYPITQAFQPFCLRGFMRKLARLLSPEGMLTVTPRTPVLAPGAIVKVAVISVELTTFTLLTLTPGPPTARVASVAKFAPVTVTCTLEPAWPLAGLSLTTLARRMGAGGMGAFTPARSSHPGLLPSPARAPR